MDRLPISSSTLNAGPALHTVARAAPVTEERDSVRESPRGNTRLTHLRPPLREHEGEARPPLAHGAHIRSATPLSAASASGNSGHGTTERSGARRKVTDKQCYLVAMPQSD
ncbi:hypothetical protein GN956_G14348 [Arapaima gigas]